MYLYVVPTKTVLDHEYRYIIVVSISFQGKQILYLAQIKKYDLACILLLRFGEYEI